MTEEQRDRFLRELSVSANLAFACSAADVTAVEAIRERDDDPAFEGEWRDAVAVARARAALRADQ